MKTVIYGDILVVINILVNYLLLRVSASILRLEVKAVRLLAASVAGGFFSLIIFLDGLHWALLAGIKTAFMFFCVWLAYRPGSFKLFLKCSASFLLSNFVFAGIMLACCTVVFPNLVIYKNGIVYFDVDIFTLAASSLVCYVVLSLISRFTASRVLPKSVFDVSLFYGEKNVKGKALFDTGNSLKDSFSARPVIIAERSFLAELFGKDFDCSELRNYRLIPYSTINGGGVLPAFLADKVVAFSSDGDIAVSDVYIAVTDKKIISGGYSVLLSTSYFESAENNSVKEKDTYEIPNAK